MDVTQMYVPDIIDIVQVVDVIVLYPVFQCRGKQYCIRSGFFYQSFHCSSFVVDGYIAVQLCLSGFLSG